MKRNWKILLPTMFLLVFSSVVCSITPGTININSTEVVEEMQGTLGALESTLNAQLTQAPTLKVPDIELPGTISGDLSYPSEYLPPMKVVAFRVDNGQLTGDYKLIETTGDVGVYVITGLEPGTYWVVAYSNENPGQATTLGGGYTRAVPCGLTVECEDHSLIDIVVNSGSIVTDIDPADWYAPEGTFPANPEP